MSVSEEELARALAASVVRAREAQRLSALRHVHYIASVDAEPPCGDRTGQVSGNWNNVGCLQCRGTRGV